MVQYGYEVDYLLIFSTLTLANFEMKVTFGTLTRSSLGYSRGWKLCVCVCEVD